VILRERAHLAARLLQDGVDVLNCAGSPVGAYQPGEGERIAVVVCGANTDPATLT
jgi:hypothetical protein